MSVKKYLTLSGLTYFLNKIKTYLTSSTYLNSIGISNSDIDDIADDAGYSSGSLPASEDIFITGDIIPNTDNSVDLGASSKNIKMIYTKGITINGDIIPNTDNSVDLGASSKNIKMIYTKGITINGVACGDILTHNVSEFVDVTSAQTIGGLKTFSANGCKFYKQIVVNHDLSYSKDNPPPSPGAYHNLMFTDASGWWGAYIENVTSNDGNSTLAFYVRNTNETHSRVYLKCGIDGSFSMYPLSHNVWDLGTSTNKWKSINGIAPDELGLPTSAYTDVSSYITHFDSTPNEFTAPVSGLLFIEGTNTTPTECTINNNTKQYRMTVPYAFYNIRGLFPVEKGDSITVYIYKLSNLTNAKIYHLKGKV